MIRELREFTRIIFSESSVYAVPLADKQPAEASNPGFAQIRAIRG
jgi:hypothetical protein